VSAHFQAVNWNRQKIIYDGIALSSALGFMGLFAVASLVLQPTITAETLLIRGLGLTALVLLHVILCIGPLCRLDPRFLPLLYNRRHLGVLMCILALGHAVFAVIQFHALGDQPALESLLTASGSVRDISRFPFELLGLAALLILWTMAVTSHDFWLALLSAASWKRLHMTVYVAYALVLAHVALGAMQADTSPILAGGLAAGAALVFGLHLVAATRERAGDAEVTSNGDGWVDVGSAEELQEGRARTARVGSERVALVRHDGGISCLSNVCRHQGGPLGEGRIVDGCLTCPWHGYQYVPGNGTSPPPFTEKIATYRVRIVGGRIQVHESPNPPGTPVPPAVVAGHRARAVGGAA
jgi:nitrite reductase/ring-hydroxylating ferredoxin subunit/DMSO/TMAO reductase YedYZ heme-binding membrane subunit